MKPEFAAFIRFVNGPGPVANCNSYDKAHRNQFQQHVLKAMARDVLLDTIFDHTYKGTLSWKTK